MKRRVVTIPLIVDGPYHYHPACGHQLLGSPRLSYNSSSLRVFPSLPGSRLTIFYRDASSVLFQLVNLSMVELYLLVLSVTEEQKPRLTRINLTTSALAGV